LSLDEILADTGLKALGLPGAARCGALRPPFPRGPDRRGCLGDYHHKEGYSTGTPQHDAAQGLFMAARRA